MKTISCTEKKKSTGVVIGQAGEGPNGSSRPCRRRGASFHIGSDWGTVDVSALSDARKAGECV
jgi:hypothetical protein